ncbi:nicotinate-nucleotide adenylyltransferase [Periweissella fabaria]|nr:nicotinate-nucleotide adenylyltransferase [Periweissella fabaria]MCM0597776.1 nicotinate-nucleotide adenylyltransferase [Periweissella fabaria]
MTVFTPDVALALESETVEIKRRVGIMGGTFNPIHNGHLIMAEQVRSQLGLDEILFIPNNIPPHIDTKTAIDGTTRAKLIELAIEDNSDFNLERIELIKGGVSYSIDTIAELKRQHPDTEYYFIIGADEVAYLPKWYRIDELITMVTFVAIKRVGFTQTSEYPVIWIDTPIVEISSTDVRQRIEQQRSIRYLVPLKVADYIVKNGLYQDDKH